MQMHRLVLHLATWCIALVLIAQPAAAQPLEGANACAPPNYKIHVRPDPPGSPTEVQIGVLIVDLVEINDVDRTISIDLALRMRWTDPRLAAWNGCKLSVDDIWFPELVLDSSGKVFERWPLRVRIGEGGQVIYLQRVSGTLSSYHKLTDFPFDSQKISMSIFPLEWSRQEVVFRPDETFSGIASPINISDWQIHGVDAWVADEQFDIFEQVRSVYILDILAQRHQGYYILKTMLPIALIVVMSWSVFWIDPEQFGTQIGLSATSVLTMIAFIFATTNMLPRLGYFTVLDRYIATATVFVFVALLQSLATGFLVSRGRAALARRVDAVSRVAFPAAFALLCAQLYASVASGVA